MSPRKLSYCAEQVRAHDSDRFLTVLFAPAEARDALFTLYAFNLEISKIHESAREPMLADIRFQWWREAIAQMYEGVAPRHPVVQTLQDVVQKYDLPKCLIEAFLEARAVNIAIEAHETYDEFVHFATSVSTPLMSMALIVLGGGKDALQEPASKAATAWGLTELLRAAPRNLRARRNYLPRDLMKEFSVSIQDVAELRSSTQLSGLAEFICKDIENRARDARSEYRAANRSCISPMLVASLSRQYKGVFKRAGFDIFHPNFTDTPALRGWNLAYHSVIGRI